MKVDTSDHSDEKAQGKVVPAGQYELRVSSLEPGLVQSEKAKNYGARKFDGKFSVVSDDEEHDGHTVYDVFAIVESQMRKIKQLLRALGYDDTAVNLIVDEEEDEEDDELENIYLEDLVGETVNAKVKVRPGSKDYGKKNEVERYLPA